MGNISALPVRTARAAFGAAEIGAVEIPTIADFAYLGTENLISFVIIGSGNVDMDVDELRAISGFTAEHFRYYELIVVASATDGAWLNSLRQACAGEPNARIGTVAQPLNFEESVAVALNQTIGDYIVIVAAGEVGPEDLTRLVSALAEGQNDLVKAAYRIDAVPVTERMAARLAQGIIWMVTGFSVQKFQARAVALSRNGATRIQGSARLQKFFRILDVSGVVAQTSILIDRSRRRTLFADGSEKLRLTTELISRSSARLIRALAVICMILSLTSLGATLLSFMIWMFKSDVAPGWTSLAMISSFLFSANFGVLSSICLGLLLLIRRGESDLAEVSLTEISGGDLFLRDTQLNVKTGDAGA